MRPLAAGAAAITTAAMGIIAQGPDAAGHPAGMPSLGMVGGFGAMTRRGGRPDLALYRPEDLRVGMALEVALAAPAQRTANARVRAELDLAGRGVDVAIHRRVDQHLAADPTQVAAERTVDR